MYVSSFVLKRIKDAYEISNPDDDGIPILQIDTTRIERFKLKWPYFCDKQNIEKWLEQNNNVTSFIVPYKTYDSNNRNITEFITDLRQLASEKFITKYCENPPAWYREQIKHVFSV